MGRSVGNRDNMCPVWFLPALRSTYGHPLPYPWVHLLGYAILELFEGQPFSDIIPLKNKKWEKTTPMLNSKEYM